MKKNILTLSALSLAIGLGFSTAQAASYFVVVPVPAKLVALKDISVSMASSSLPDGVIGNAYSYDMRQLLSVTGDPNYTGSNVAWSLESGSLPAGLSFGADGVISGTPTSQASSTFSVKATYKTKTGAQSYRILVTNIAVGLAGATLPGAQVGQAYSYDIKPLLSVSGDPTYDISKVTWSTVSSSLPSGLSLNSDGTISGTPTASGTGTLTARATYKGFNGDQAYQIVTIKIDVALAAGTPPGAQVGQNYSYDLKPLLSVTGDSGYNIANVAWTVVSSSLPNGLTLRTDGTIAGNPTVSGTGTLVARASYKGVNGDQTYQIVTIKVNVALAAATLPDAEVNQPYSFDLKTKLSVTGDSGYTGSGVTWSVVSSTLPAGLSLRTDGTIGGTPTVAGSGTVVARATYKNVNGDQTYQVLTYTLNATLSDVAFGSVNAGTPSDQVATLSNTGSKDITLTVPTAANVTGTGFSFVSTTCGATLPAGQNCTTTVRYTPTAQASANGSLSIATSAGNKTATLTGQSLQAVLTFNPTSYAFPDTVVGQTATSPDITLTNSGNTAATGITYAPTAAYTIDPTSTCGTSLAAGASCTLKMKFTPAAAQSY